MSKITDMSELDPHLMGMWKTLYLVKAKYVDKSASTPIVLSVSVDNGAFQDLPMQYVGTGDGGQQDAYFHTIATAKYFQFLVTWPSSTKNFQFDGLEIQFTPRGDEFKIR
jgi:hypothetical protein